MLSGSGSDNGVEKQQQQHQQHQYNGSMSGPPQATSLYGSASTTSANSRFPPIGTFSLDSNNVYNSAGDSSPVFTGNGNIGGGSGGGYMGGMQGGGGSGGSVASMSDSNSANQGTRETGIIEKLLHSYGFIQCCERQARLFFHFSQFSGNIEHLKIGDPVEFEMTYDRRTGKPIASSVTKIAPEVVMSEERVTGTVTTEIRGEGSSGDIQGRISYENRGECFFLPYTKDDVEGNVTLRSGDKVSFQIATNNRGNLGACHVRLENPAHPVKYQGVVCSMKESFGFIERADIVKEIFFHFSEARTKEELRLGDDVEFTIQTRNGKEVACSITRLPPGTVIFEDLKPDIVKGQVLKPLDRGNNLRHQQQSTDALPGRIRYRAPDHSEVEISFGDKDQRGDFTLRHGDWVQFKVATDRRDQLNRATNISLLPESFAVSGEKREQGVVASVKDGFGFLRCVEREQRLFFHFNEVLDVEREVRVGDEFEFTAAQDYQGVGGIGPNAASRPSAIRMLALPPGRVQFETRVESELSGVITKEVTNSWLVSRSPTKSNNGSPLQQQQNGNTAEHVEAGLIQYSLNSIKKTVPFYSKDIEKQFPRLGDKVQFNINQIKRNKEFIAVDIQVMQSATQSNGITKRSSHSMQLYQGFVAALKDSFGFIETVDHDREVFFHFSNFDGDANNLELGQEVEYNLGSRGNSGSCSSAENVKIISKGTINLPKVSGEVLDGVVIRPLRSVNPDQTEYSGLIQIKSADNNHSLLSDEEPFSPSSCDSQDPPVLDSVEANLMGVETPNDSVPLELEFGIMGLVNKRELLQVGDAVQLQRDVTGRAANIIAVRKKLRATVDAIKGQFGFLAYEVDEGKKLFFHMSEVRDSGTSALQIGDQVEFVLVTNQRSGKSSACNVVKVVDVQARPERLISRLRTVSLDEGGPRLTVVRQPRGPDATGGFSADMRTPRIPGIVPE